MASGGGGEVNRPPRKVSAPHNPQGIDPAMGGMAGLGIGGAGRPPVGMHGAPSARFRAAGTPSRAVPPGAVARMRARGRAGRPNPRADAGLRRSVSAKQIPSPAVWCGLWGRLYSGLWREEAPEDRGRVPAMLCGRCAPRRGDRSQRMASGGGGEVNRPPRKVSAPHNPQTTVESPGAGGRRRDAPALGRGSSARRWDRPLLPSPSGWM